MTIVSEALLAVGIIMVSMAFVLVGGNIISFQTEGLFQSTQNRIPAQISKLVREMPSASGTYSTTFQPSIESYTLQIQSNRTVTAEVPDAGRSSTTFLDYRMENTVIRNAEEICITKKSDNISITRGSCETGNLNNFCANGRCINNICQPDRGENCANSGGDCTCNTQCQPDYEAGTYMNPIQGAGDSIDDTDRKECVLTDFYRAQDNPGDRCEYDFECGTDSGQDLQCNSATVSSGLSGSYCCPAGKRWAGSTQGCVNANVFDIVFVPMDYPDSEISSFQSVSKDSFEYFRDSVSPFKSCSTPSAHTKAEYADNANGVCDISSSCDWGGPPQPGDPNPYLGNEPRSSWEGCWAEMRDCANRVYGSDDWDMVMAMNKGDGFSWGGLAKWFDVGAAIVDDIPEPDTDQTTAHEIGHTVNLRHVEPDGGNICASGGACQPPNAGDCNAPPSLSERRNFMMSYCSSLDRFGPEGYDHMKQNSLQPYLWGSC